MDLKFNLLKLTMKLWLKAQRASYSLRCKIGMHYYLPVYDPQGGRKTFCICMYCGKKKEVVI